MLAVEWIVLGRSAYGEQMVNGQITDSWRVKKDGRLIWADTFRCFDEHIRTFIRRRCFRVTGQLQHWSISGAISMIEWN